MWVMGVDNQGDSDSVQGPQGQPRRRRRRRGHHPRPTWVVTMFTCIVLQSVGVHGTLDVHQGAVAQDLDHQNNLLYSSDRIGDDKKTSSSLSGRDSCQPEISRICNAKPDSFSDLDTLECILNQKRDDVDQSISDTCNHALWELRKGISTDSGFFGMLGSDCVSELKSNSKLDCWKGAGLDTALEAPPSSSTILNCVIEKKDQITKERCRDLVTRLEGVIFSDYELMERFTDKCHADITQFKCGRNDLRGLAWSKQVPRSHSQGKTIECLSEKIAELGGECAIEILRVAELQVDDFHLDRALYFACRDDRERLCPQVPAGNGRVYKCLQKHKMDVEMSSSCREQVYRRQRLGWQDYRASGIVASCRSEIRKFRCRRDANNSDKMVRLSQILLCLEDAVHSGNEINSDCVDEMRQHRKSLMQDYSVTPELVKGCKEELKKCSGQGLNGKTLHCLMSQASSRHIDDKVSDACRVALEDLLKMSDVSSDWRVDPVLQEKCQKVVDTSGCSKLSPDRILDCLMNLLVTDTGGEASPMTDGCETALLQIQYFITRDFPMDNLLFQACHEDATKVCSAKPDWAEDSKTMDPNRGPLVLSCLFRSINSGAGMGNEDEAGTPVSLVSPKCAERVKETMRQRALSVRLLPEVEAACLEDLSDLCSDKTRAGQEIECLQNNLEELSTECKSAVANFTQEEMKNPTIDPFLWKYCRDLIQGQCNEEQSDEADMLECLIDHKTEMKNKKCRVSVEHMELLRLKDIRFTPKFKTQCHESVIRYCNNEHPITAGSLVSCLSDIIRKDTMTENTQRVTKGCRKQVRYLLLSKVGLENQKADAASVYALCRPFIQTHCGKVKPGGGRILECLRGYRDEIAGSDKKCFKALFHVQEEVNSDPTLDVVLTQDCDNEIKLFCPPSPGNKGENLLLCLHMNSNREGFDSARCGRIVRARLIEQNSDMRLSPRLQKACKLDIPKFCGKVQQGEGRILTCLKKAFVSPKSRLSPSCKDHVEGILQSAAQSDIRLDNTLYTACKADMDLSCPSSDGAGDPTDDTGGDGGKAEECLKDLFRSKKLTSTRCREQVGQLIQSSQVDIHVDPILNNACALDLMKHCDGIPAGEGRLVACLLNQLDLEKTSKGTSRLAPLCRTLLSKREEMFALAGTPQRLDGIQDLYSQVSVSPHRNYFLVVAMSVVGIIFIVGLFCGRATHRRAASKNK